MNSNLGHLESNTSSQGQIKEIPCGHSRGHISCSIDLKSSQNLNLDEISDELNFGHQGSKTRSLSQLKKIPSGRCRGHISCSIDLKIDQNVFLDEISNLVQLGSKTRSPGQMKEIHSLWAL